MELLEVARRRIAGSIAVALTLSVCLGASLRAQTASIPTLKAAYLLNFAKFAEWPAESMAAGSPLALCIVGDDAVADALAEMTKGRTVEGHQPSVRKLDLNGPLRSCHVLYVGDAGANGAAGVLEKVQGTAVLSVGSDAGFAAEGGIAGFFEEAGKMRFAVNVDAADRAKVRLSSRLLTLAKIVKDNHAFKP